eukprot:1147569-Pelagomonas_calceolata.AAC.1
MPLTFAPRLAHAWHPGNSSVGRSLMSTHAQRIRALYKRNAARKRKRSSVCTGRGLGREEEATLLPLNDNVNAESSGSTPEEQRQSNPAVYATVDMIKKGIAKHQPLLLKP